MPETDWKAVLVDIGERIEETLRVERSNLSSQAQQIGESIVRDQSTDTTAAVGRYKQIEAKIEGLKSSQQLVRGYLNGTYQLTQQS
ncbi:MAG TPA: hypothetical protein VF281_00545 [Candidatus Saccharimonadales bacterium]